MRIEVMVDYRPKKQGKKFDEWCKKWGCEPLNGGRQAWCPSFSTYLRDAIGIATTKSGENFLIYPEDIEEGKRL